MSWLVPDFLKPYLRAYLEQHRPVLLAGNASHAVWIRACRQLSQTTLATRWTAARKFRAVFS